MKIFIRILLLLLVIFLGVIGIILEFGGNEIGFMSYFKYLSALCLLSIGIITFFVEWNNYRKNKKLLEFSVTCIALLFCSVIFYAIAKRSFIENTTVFTKVSNLPAAKNRMTFEFREYHNLKLIEYSGSILTVYYGKYKRNGDTISIKESNYDGYVKKLPAFGVIRNDTMFWNKFDTMLVDKR
ncbi:hypothetical protein [Ferruginibacter sp. SUN106]|uniref:hypothetical protein n=1 Tax=Ferruginibacter sp. SUN106 TaxID=2978348 RepID=UPI003D35D958